ncbi:MAG: hypothetical protein AAB874_00305, partial [Patescibacteria group bacterium]
MGNQIKIILRFISSKNVFELFLTSFLIIFLELSLIRFIPAYVRYLGYFTNVILLGAFLGIGIGCLLTKTRFDLLPWFSPLLLIVIFVVKVFRFEVGITTNQVVYFTSNSGDSRIESFLLLPGVFILITLLFVTLAQTLGKLLTRFPPLSAYTVDIVGSIAGVAAFGLVSYFTLPPFVWFVVIGIGYLVLLFRFSGKGRTAAIFLIFIFFLIPTLDDLPTRWSPYQKVSLYSVSNPHRQVGQPDNHWRIYVNGISHQDMTEYSQIAPFYKLVYSAFPTQKISNALIVGAGSGQDVAVALRNNVSQIDAVEIDPVIADLGLQYHPEQPYKDPRVRLHINDARSYLENSPLLYDLVIFALPDSTVLTTSLTSLRLESYLFTTEAFRQVKKHLKSDGIFVLYNYYRTPWLIDKIAQMLALEFHEFPYVTKYEDNLAVFAISNNAKIIPAHTFTRWQPREDYKPATDDWPFLYLTGPTLPRVYIKSLAILGLIAAALVLMVTKGKVTKYFSGDFFFLGAAFLLIET